MLRANKCQKACAVDLLLFDKRLTPEDDEAIAERLWPIVREMARVANENGQSLIIEGVSLPVVEAGRFAH